MEPQIIRIWKAPPGKEAKYVTIDEKGQFVRGFSSLAAVREYYNHAIQAGAAVLKRELQNTYKPKPAAQLLRKNRKESISDKNRAGEI